MMAPINAYVTLGNRYLKTSHGFPSKLVYHFSSWPWFVIYLVESHGSKLNICTFSRHTTLGHVTALCVLQILRVQLLGAKQYTKRGNQLEGHRSILAHRICPHRHFVISLSVILSKLTRELKDQRTSSK